MASLLVVETMLIYQFLYPPQPVTTYRCLISESVNQSEFANTSCPKKAAQSSE